ncbi:hypothetical protein Glo7428_0471 [Gloeocapsa sp. PCC 7428]|nr:hypothetical protein Glo7428_0471 [Gloeocapsa sp. PCC 7428]
MLSEELMYALRYIWLGIAVSSIAVGSTAEQQITNTLSPGLLI